MLPSVVPAQVLEQWHSKLDQRTDPAEKNDPTRTKKGSIFFSSLGALIAQGEKTTPSATNATEGSLHTMSLQASTQRGPQKPGTAAQLLLQQPGITKPHPSGWEASFGFLSSHLLLCKRTTNQENWHVLRHQQRVH